MRFSLILQITIEERLAGCAPTSTDWIIHSANNKLYQLFKCIDWQCHNVIDQLLLLLSMTVEDSFYIERFEWRSELVLQSVIK